MSKALDLLNLIGDTIAVLVFTGLSVATAWRFGTGLWDGRIDTDVGLQYGIYVGVAVAFRLSLQDRLGRL